jgi:hypothetical protein
LSLVHRLQRYVSDGPDVWSILAKEFPPTARIEFRNRPSTKCQWRMK